MKVHFFDQPERGLLPREDVRFNDLGLFMYEDRRRVAVGFDITPFRERPNLAVILRNEAGKEVGSLDVIEAMTANFHLTMHIRDGGESDKYDVEAILYYTNPESGELLVVDNLHRTLDANVTGSQ